MGDIKTSEMILEILKMELTPALGCTEPAAVALAAAYASQAVGGDVLAIGVKTDPNVYKNGMGVYVPNADTYGLPVAAAMGAVGGDPLLDLRVLHSVNEDHLVSVRQLVSKGNVFVEPWGDAGSIYIRAEVTTTKGVGIAEIAQKHNNLVTLIANDHILVQRPFSDATIDKAVELYKIPFTKILRGIEATDLNDLAFLEEGISMNYKAAQAGLEHELGLGLGFRLMSLVKKGVLGADLPNMVMLYTAAAADARMKGFALPIMSISGSGNQGITASIPIYIAAQHQECPKEDMIRALAVSQIVTLYAKQYMGRLSAICACAVAASVGACAGITYLLGGDIEQVQNAIKNMAANLTGVICDGAKTGCSLKLATAAATAAQIALLTLEGMAVLPTDGIVAETAEETLKNIGRISNPGMIETDKVILEVMMDNQKRSKV